MQNGNFINITFIIAFSTHMSLHLHQSLTFILMKIDVHIA